MMHHKQVSFHFSFRLFHIVMHYHYHRNINLQHLSRQSVIHLRLAIALRASLRWCLGSFPDKQHHRVNNLRRKISQSVHQMPQKLLLTYFMPTPSIGAFAASLLSPPKALILGCHTTLGPDIAFSRGKYHGILSSRAARSSWCNSCKPEYWIASRAMCIVRSFGVLWPIRIVTSISSTRRQWSGFRVLNICVQHQSKIANWICFIQPRLLKCWV